MVPALLFCAGSGMIEHMVILKDGEGGEEMTVLVCVEDRMGQSFHGKRLSRDRALYVRIAAAAAGTALLRMSPYSQPLFENTPLLASEDYLDQAAEEDWCFVEREDLAPYAEKIDRLVLYRWNRTYPFDQALAFPLEGWRLASSQEFPGFSHEKITEEIYERL